MMLNFYYIVKPFIPRRLQLFLRRKVVLRQKMLFGNVWPINSMANKKPEKWIGWPDGKKFVLILTHDVDTERGQSKCYDLMHLEMRLGFRSSFNFVPERYSVLTRLRHELTENGFEIGVHGLYHDGKYFKSRTVFKERANRINYYLREWNAVGYRSPSMLHNLEWFHDLDVVYDASTFDTDPFEPQSDGVGTIFPFWVPNKSNEKGYVELPYTLPQDFTLFILMKEKTIDVWKQKLDWVVQNNGMVLLNVHPDYMNFDGKIGIEEYPCNLYEDFLQYVRSKYSNQYWHILPKELACFWEKNYKGKSERVEHKQI